MVRYEDSSFTPSYIPRSIVAMIWKMGNMARVKWCATRIAAVGPRRSIPASWVEEAGGVTFVPRARCRKKTSVSKVTSVWCLDVQVCLQGKTPANVVWGSLMRFERFFWVYLLALLVLFGFILFYLVSFCFIWCHFVLFCFIRFYLVLFGFICFTECFFLTVTPQKCHAVTKF